MVLGKFGAVKYCNVAVHGKSGTIEVSVVATVTFTDSRMASGDGIMDEN